MLIGTTSSILAQDTYVSTTASTSKEKQGVYSIPVSYSSTFVVNDNNKVITHYTGDGTIVNFYAHHVFITFDGKQKVYHCVDTYLAQVTVYLNFGMYEDSGTSITLDYSMASNKRKQRPKRPVVRFQVNQE